MTHDQTHDGCCSHCEECNPPEQRDAATMRRTYGKPLFELAEGDAK